jgi:hypothetical protein
MSRGTPFRQAAKVPQRAESAEDRAKLVAGIPPRPPNPSLAVGFGGRGELAPQTNAGHRRRSGRDNRRPNGGSVPADWPLTRDEFGPIFLKTM